MEKSLLASNLALAYMLTRLYWALKDPGSYRDTDPDPGVVWEEVFDIFVTAKRALLDHAEDQNPRGVEA
jgi:hypothetical protein